MRRIDDHPLWESHILPLLYTNGNTPRERIEMREPGAVAERPWLLAIEVDCVECQRTINPIRARDGWGTLYLTVSCQVNPGCHKGKSAAEETTRLRDQIHGWTDPQQPGLFDWAST
jgi:hypothetical protein